MFSDYESFLELCFVINTLHATWDRLNLWYVNIADRVKDWLLDILKNNVASEPGHKRIEDLHAKQEKFQGRASKFGKSIGVVSAICILGTLYSVEGSRPVDGFLLYWIPVMGLSTVFCFVVMFVVLAGRSLKASILVLLEVFRWPARTPPKPPPNDD